MLSIDTIIGSMLATLALLYFLKIAFNFDPPIFILVRRTIVGMFLIAVIYLGINMLTGYKLTLHKAILKPFLPKIERPIKLAPTAS